MEVLKRLLGIKEQELELEVKKAHDKIEHQDRKLEEIHAKIENLEEKVDSQEDLGEEVQELKQSFYDSRPVTAQLSETERELLEIFLRKEEWLDKSDISKEMDISKNYAGTLISNIRDQVEIQTKKVGSNNKKAYKLSEQARERIEQGI